MQKYWMGIIVAPLTVGVVGCGSTINLAPQEHYHCSESAIESMERFMQMVDEGKFKPKVEGEKDVQ